MINNVGSSLSQQIPNLGGSQQANADKLAAYQQNQPKQKAEENKIQESRQAETATTQETNPQTKNDSNSNEVQAAAQAAEKSEETPQRGSFVDIAV